MIGLASTGCAALLLAWSATIYAQTGAIRGKISALNGQELIVGTPSGEVKAVLTDQTVVRAEQPIKFSRIVPGMYPPHYGDETVRWTFLGIGSPCFLGGPTRHRPLGSAPGSAATMTNTNVERVEEVAVQNIKGRLMTLKHKGGEVKVLVPPDVPVVNRIVTDRSGLKPGVEVSIQGKQNADGGLTVNQITVRADRR